MNLLPWLSEPALCVDTLGSRDRQIITGICQLEIKRLDQEIERLERQFDALFSCELEIAMSELDATNPTFLALPKPLATLERDRLYYSACLEGRLFYRSDHYTYDQELGHAVYTPVHFTRKMIHDHIAYVVCLPDDPQFASTIPLAFRVGMVVGWLSGLAVAQKDDAQAGMVLLSALVAPLLLCKEQATPVKQNKRLPAPKRKGSRSKKSRKS